MKTFQKKEIPTAGNTLTDSCIRILMVEDNPGDMFLITEYIRASNKLTDITYASNLKETFAICGEKEFDVILLDLGLPESTGLETLKKLQVFKIKSPVIVMTGLDDEDVALSALREGAQDYLVKNSLSTDTILRAINYGIERKKIQDMLERNTSQFSILSSATSQISKCESISEIHYVTSNNLKQLLNTNRILSVEFENDFSVRISCHEWLEPWFAEIRKQLGIDLKNYAFRLPVEKFELPNLFTSAILHEFKDKLYDVFGGTVNREQCLEIEKIVGINRLYAYGLVNSGNIYGGILIFSEDEISKNDVCNIETLLSHAALSIHRKRILKDLSLSENRFKELNKDLEQKIFQRTIDLESANSLLNQELTARKITEKALKKSEASLKELIATKDKFFNIVAHDLKNPFTGLLGSSELLYSNITQMSDEEIITLATILNDSAKSGFAILQNLLDWSRSQTGMLRINLAQVRLSELIETNVSNHSLSARNKEISLSSEVDENLIITADSCMVNTVLRNLISNAIKFTPRGGKIVTSAYTDSKNVFISVKDSGIGISPENISSLFKLDVKYSNPGTENEVGTGLGLKLSKEFVEKQGGEIRVNSEAGKGTEFVFSIPIPASE
jgi:signal transduction histidine kinase/DNA-binding NarL/FixJ family response regulator